MGVLSRRLPLGLPRGLPVFEGVSGAFCVCDTPIVSSAESSPSSSSLSKISAAIRASVVSSSTSLFSAIGARNALALFLRADRSLRAAVGVSIPFSSSL